jgi:membrane protein DedA with SNARE-associated domain
VLRETVAWVAGLAGMSWRRFLFWNALGGIVWATGVGLLAYLGGKALADAISRYGLYAGATVTVFAVIVAIAPKLIASARAS